jgi:hypothetical protein
MPHYSPIQAIGIPGVQIRVIFCTRSRDLVVDAKGSADARRLHIYSGDPSFALDGHATNRALHGSCQTCEPGVTSRSAICRTFCQCTLHDVTSQAMGELNQLVMNYSELRYRCKQSSRCHICLEVQFVLFTVEVHFGQDSLTSLLCRRSKHSVGVWW